MSKMLTYSFMILSYFIILPACATSQQTRLLTAGIASLVGGSVLSMTAPATENRNQQAALGFALGAAAGFTIANLLYSDEEEINQALKEKSQLEEKLKLLNFAKDSRNSKKLNQNMTLEPLNNYIIPIRDSNQAWGFDEVYELRQ